MLVQEHLETGSYVLDVPLVALCVGFRTEPLNGVFVLIYGFHNRFSLQTQSTIEIEPKP